MIARQYCTAFLGLCLTAFVLVGLAFGAEQLTDEQIRELAPKVTDYRVKFRLIAAGLPAMMPLFDQMENKDERIVFETASTLRWIAEHAGEDPAQRAPAAAKLIEVVNSDRPIEQRSLAVSLLGLAGGDQAVETLAALLGDERLRDPTLASLIQIEGRAAAQAMVAAIPQSPPDFRCALLRALGIRHDPEVTSVLIEEAKGADENVRLAAVEALGASQDPAAMPALMDAIKGASDDLKKAALAAYVKIADGLLEKGQSTKAAEGYTQVLELASDDASRSAALKGLGRTGDPAAIPKVTAAVENASPEVKAAALDACLRLADSLLDQGKKEQALPLYSHVLEAGATESELMRALAGYGRMGDAAFAKRVSPFLKSEDPRVQAAAASALQKIEGGEATAALSSALKDASPTMKQVLLAALTVRKDPAAISDIIPLADDEDEEVSTAAINALGAIADPAAIPVLQEAAEKGAGKVKEAAIEACVKIGDAELAKGRRNEAMEIYHRALDQGAKKQALAMALDGLAQIADPVSLPLIEPLLDKAKDDIREKALKAFTAIGDTLASQQQRDEAARIFEKALSLDKRDADALKQKLRSLGRKVEFEVKDGKIAHWWIVGPFPAPDIASWEKPFFPEEEIDLTKEYEVEGKKYQWRPVDTLHKDALVDFEKILGPNDNVVAYAYTEVIAKNEQDVFLRSGSDDGLLIWSNGERVFAFLEPRSPKVDEDKVKVHLKEGPNALLLKICEKSGGWGFFVRITDEQDRPLSFKVR